jgi:hypothetical protein
MGRIVRSRAGRRMFVGVLAIGGLALAACAPVKPAPEPPPEVPPICIPNPTNSGDPAARAEPAPTEPDCTPICLPGQEPQPDTKAQLQEPAPTEPTCVPICRPSDGGGGSPEASVQVQQRCIRIPIPCVPGVDIPDCVNFCPPGQEPPPAQEALEPAPEFTRCTPLCVLIPRGLPGACDEKAQLPRY